MSLPTPMDDTVATVLQQQFAQQANHATALLNRTTAGDQAVAELVRNGAAQLATITLAKASTTLDAGLAKEILNQRSAENQPQEGTAAAK